MGKVYVRDRITGEPILATYRRINPNKKGIESMILRAIQDAFFFEWGYQPSMTKTDMYSDDGQCMGIQYWFNQETNKVFIEYKLQRAISSKVNIDRFRLKVEEYLDNNFRYMIDIWPETIFFEDNKDDLNWAGDLLTPFSIGYIKSLSGGYEFISDKTQVLTIADPIIHPKRGTKPDKNIKDWFDIVMKICKKYTNNLTAEQRKNFREECLSIDETFFAANNTYRSTVEDIIASYGVDYYDEIPEEYRDEADARLKAASDVREAAEAKYNNDKEKLYSKYGIRVNLNSKIPQEFNEYKEEFKKFFGKDLISINATRSIYRININN